MRHFATFAIGAGSLLVACVEELRRRGHTVHGVFCSDPSTRASLTALGMAVHPLDTDLDAALGAVPFDYLFSVNNPRILTPRVLALPAQLAVNYHDGPLPRYAGMHATTWALINRETRHAVTWHVAVPQVDAGDILHQVAVPIETGDTAHSLNLRCFQAAVSSFGELAQALSDGTCERRPQDLRLRTWFGRDRRPEGASVLRFSRPAGELAALVSALSFGAAPNPLAAPRLAFGARYVAVGEAHVATDGSSGAAPGTVVAATERELRVATAHQDLWLGGLTTLDGRALFGAELAAHAARGMTLVDPDARALERFAALESEICRSEPWWVSRLADVLPPDLGWAPTPAAQDRRGHDAFVEAVPAQASAVLASADGDTMLLAAFGGVLARLGSGDAFDLAWADAGLERDVSGATALFALFVPVRVEAPRARAFGAVHQGVRASLALVRSKRTHALDVGLRFPALRARAAPHALPVAVSFGATASRAGGDVLTLQVLDQGHQWRWSWDPGRLGEPQVRAVASQLARVLDAAAASPSLRIRELPVLSPGERSQVVIGFNGPSLLPAEPPLVHHAFAEQARRSPAALAVDDGRVALSYAELDRRSNRLARLLSRRGAAPEQCVAVWVERSAEWVVAMLAVARSGAAYCPLDPREAPARARRMVADAGARLVITSSSTRGDFGVERIELDASATREALERESDAPFDAPCAGRQLAYVIFTSGTTGVPNGVAVEHRQLAHFASEHCRLAALGARDRVSQMSSPAFDASLSEVWPTLLSGAALLITDDAVRASPEAFLEWALARHVTVTGMPTLLAEAVFQLPISASAGLRLLTTGGSTLTRRPPHGAGFRVQNAYGPTEATVYVTADAVDPGDSPVDTIGGPIRCGRVFVLDEEGEVLPLGVLGELYVGGASVARGYLGRPGLTAARFVPDPLGGEPGARLYRTGDRAYWRADGRLSFRGRIDRQVKLRGFRVELGEIESALSTAVGVREAVVTLREDRPGEPRLVAYLVLEAGGPSVPDALKAHVRDVLPPHMVPSSYVLLDALPRTIGGKVDPAALPPPQLSTRRGDYVAPRNPTEAALAEIWEQVFSVAQIGVHEDFFDLGGQSLIATRIAGRTVERLGVDVSLVDVLESPTVARLAEWVDRLRAAELRS